MHVDMCGYVYLSVCLPVCLHKLLWCNFNCCSDPYVKITFHGSNLKVYPHFTKFAHNPVPKNYKTKTIYKVQLNSFTNSILKLRFFINRLWTLCGMPLLSLQWVFTIVIAVNYEYTRYQALRELLYLTVMTRMSRWVQSWTIEQCAFY